MSALHDAATIKRWRQHPPLYVRERFNVEPDAWQDDVLGDFPTHQQQAMQAPISLDETVYTPDGRRRWRDVQPGDLVFADDGSPTRVLRRIDVGKVPLYRMTLTDGSSVTVSGEHLWKVQTAKDRKHRRWSNRTTRQILSLKLKLPNGQHTVSLPVQGPAEFASADLPLDPYIFGLWLGDGVRNESSLVCPDVAIRDELTRKGIAHRARRRNDAKNITLFGMRGRWSATGVHALYSHEKYIPNPYRFASVEQRFALLRGLMDSDGTVTKNGQTYYATSSLKLADDVVWLARSLGYVSWRTGPYKINGGHNRDSWRSTLSGPICPFAADTMKKTRWRQPLQYKYTRFIDSIEQVEFGEAMCISVANASECFLISDFIVTHNCKGPGKTALEAWLAWNFLETRPHPKIAAVSITKENLRDNLWSEMSKWQQKSDFLKAEFQWTGTRIFYKPHPETWFMSARSYPKSATNEQLQATLAGLHADYILFLVDESGAMPPAVVKAGEDAMSSCIEGHIVQAGNPLLYSGALYVAVKSGGWKVYEITGDPDDPKRSSRVNIEWAAQQIARYGRNNPYVMISVLGKFPPSAINSLLSVDEVDAAIARKYRPDQIEHAARILGVDVARQGTASSVIFPRQGLVAFDPIEMRNVDSKQGASAVINKKNAWEADAVFVDATGGWGWGWIDFMREMGHAPVGVQFSSQATDTRQYFNKRAEMHWLKAQWIKDGGAIPDIPELREALSATTYTHVGDRVLIEDKEQLADRLGFSPDHDDALGLTFSHPVTARPKHLRLFPHLTGARRRPSEWTPMAALDADRYGMMQ